MREIKIGNLIVRIPEDVELGISNFVIDRKGNIIEPGVISVYHKEQQ